jgi:valyl-tRNA synthetase
VCYTRNTYADHAVDHASFCAPLYHLVMLSTHINYMCDMTVPHLQLMAPFTPFLTEHMYQNLVRVLPTDQVTK